VFYRRGTRTDRRGAGWRLPVTALLSAALGLSAAAPAAADLAPDPVLSDIFVASVTGMRPDFIRGVDIGSVIANENSGVRYFNWDGEEQDIFVTLAEAGVNMVRIRIWNDPWYVAADGTRHGFGGGNNDVDQAIVIGQRATAAGMGVQLNFHYSDFWADPGKQMSPRAWEGLNLVDRAAALGEFTYESVTRIIEAGVDVWQVQVGNETNGAMAGVSGWNSMIPLFRAGSEAVRRAAESTGTDIQVAVHFTNPQNASALRGFAANLAGGGVEFDVFGASYYSFWHGTLENLTWVLSQIARDHDVDVMVMETSWAFTPEDGDGFPNNVPFTGLDPKYPLSVQGQANAVRDVFQAVANVDGGRGLGVIYWEPAWTPVGRHGQTEPNRILWERHGSGWASSFAASFDPYDAGMWYGGSGWDNQALFDFYGHPLASLNVFRYVDTGAVPRGGIVVDTVMDESFTIELTPGLTGADVVAAAPSTVTGVFLDNARLPLPVEWSASTIETALATAAGRGGINTFTIPGEAYEAATGRTFAVSLRLTIQPQNLVLNHGFESSDMSMWDLAIHSGSPSRRAYNPRSDAYAIHWGGAGQ